MTSCFVYSDSFPELVRYLTERTRDGTALRRRRGGGECEGDGEERSMKSAVIAVASRNVQKKRKGDDAWGAIEEVRRLDKEVEEEETEKPPPRLAVKPKSLLGSVENVKPFVESKVPLTVGLHPREPLRDVSAERRRADNAEDAAKKKGRSRVGAKVDPSMRMGPLEAAARGVGGAVPSARRALGGLLAPFWACRPQRPFLLLQDGSRAVYRCQGSGRGRLSAASVEVQYMSGH